MVPSGSRMLMMSSEFSVSRRKYASDAAVSTCWARPGAAAADVFSGAFPGVFPGWGAVLELTRAQSCLQVSTIRERNKSGSYQSEAVVLGRSTEPSYGPLENHQRTF